MPKLTVEGVGEFEVPAGKRLVLALEDEAGVDQLHACGGNARCTTCRVQFVAGEPDQMTQAEKTVLTNKGLIGQPGLRLSCQILCDPDMTVRAISRLHGSGRPDAAAGVGIKLTVGGGAWVSTPTGLDSSARGRASRTPGTHRGRPRFPGVREARPRAEECNPYRGKDQTSPLTTPSR